MVLEVQPYLFVFISVPYVAFLSSGKELLYLGLSVVRSVCRSVSRKNFKNYVLNKSLKIKIVDIDK